MKVYLVYGDTYFEQCGSDFHLSSYSKKTPTSKVGDELRLLLT